MADFTPDQIEMLYMAMALYREKGFPFKGGSREEHKTWQALGRETWERVKELRASAPQPQGRGMKEVTHDTTN